METNTFPAKGGAMSASKGQRHQKSTSCADDLAPVELSDDVPTCATTPAGRLSWTIRELIDIVRRR
jgi:hypothetical protein